MGINLGDFGVAVGPALNTFGQYYLRGLEDKRKRELDARKQAMDEEEQKLRQEALTLRAQEAQRDAKKAKLEERVKQRDAAFEEIKFLESRNAPAMQPTQMDMGMGGEPGVSPDEAAYMTPQPGRHPQVTVPGLTEDDMSMMVQPRNQEELIRQAVQAQRQKQEVEIQGAVEQKRLEGQLPPSAGDVYTQQQQTGRTAMGDQAAMARTQAQIAATAKEGELNRAAKKEEGSKPLSGDAAKVAGNAISLAKNLRDLDKMFRKGDYKANVALTLSGANRQSSQAMSDSRDLLKRIRTGAAASGIETPELENILLNWKDLFTGDVGTTRMAFNRVIDETNTILGLMQLPLVQIIDDKVEQVGGPTPQVPSSMSQGQPQVNRGSLPAAGGKTVVNRGKTKDGRTVVQYSDGTLEYQ